MNVAGRQLAEGILGSAGLISAHRRVGLTSAALLVIGGSWIGAALNPLSPWGMLDANHSTKRLASGRHGKDLGYDPDAMPELAMATNPTEVSFADAPVGIALEMLLESNQLNASFARDALGPVTFSNRGNAQPTWKIVGHMIGLAPRPSVQIVRRWDSFFILPRGEDPYAAPAPVAAIPIEPRTETHNRYRMAGYIDSAVAQGTHRLRIGLLETRIPGEPPRWTMAYVGEGRTRGVIGTRSATTANFETGLRVESVSPDRIVLRGALGTLQVPLSDQSVIDTVAISTETSARIARKNTNVSRIHIPVPAR